MLDDFLGGMFDFDGDGHTDLSEQATGFAILNELSQEDEAEDLDFDDDSEDWDF